ncbi:Nn.00g092820.m01.CDS01 [Neocucurbitaria sp. VM-36]
MHLSSALAVVSGLALMAIPSVAALDNAAAFQTFNNRDCSPQPDEHQNIPSDVCADLPGLSFKLSFLQPGCRFEVYSQRLCEGAPTIYTPSDYGVCKDISQKFSYKVIC